MPELPDLQVYVDSLNRFIGNRLIENARLGSISLLRTWEPPISFVVGHRVASVERIAKRIVISVDTPGTPSFMVIHLMIAGRFHWKPKGRPLVRKTDHLALDFDHGSLFLTEVSSKKRASLYLERGRESLVRHDPGGLEPLGANLAEFATRVRKENHTIKRTLTDPRLFAGIGNAYSDEILHAARMSPYAMTSKMSDDDIERLHRHTCETLTMWTRRLRAQTGDSFPERVTAFHKEMAVHGKAGEPCPVCGDPVQRIAYADNECNYCVTCQTGGRLLADRALSRLLRTDWPRTLEELEDHLAARREPSARR